MAKTEKGADGAGRPKTHPTGAALAEAEGGPVSWARAGKVGEPNDAWYTPAHFTGTAPSASVGGPVSARPAPSIESAKRKEGGDETPWSAREDADTADEAMEERGPPQRSCAPNASG